MEGFIIDLDGTVLKGKDVIAGANETIAYLRAHEKKMVFLSNRGNLSRKECFGLLKSQGADVLEEEIILTSTVAAKYLAKHYPDSKVWTLGDQGLQDELKHHHVKIATKPEEAAFLLISLHETLTYEELNMAFQAVQNGARVLATNADKTYPNEEGKAIDVAGMIGAIEGASGRKPEIFFGKPSYFMIDAALEQLQVSKEKCIVIGDSIETDIRLGKSHGIQTMLVLTGNTNKEQAQSVLERDKPDYITGSLENLIEMMEGKGQ